MESVFHLICGSTGSAVWSACFALVFSIDVVLCRETWGQGVVSVVLAAGVLCAHEIL